MATKGTRLRLLLLMLLGTMCLPALAQNNAHKVTGSVKDSTGAILPQVTVYEKGTRNGTLTTMEGNYTLSVKPNAVLVFTMVGFKTQEIAVGERNNINVVLASSATELTDVVVVGYGSTRKKSLTSAISSVTADEIGNVRGGSTVSTTLAGKVPGVSFRMADGRPGASASIQIRNMGTPLYVYSWLFSRLSAK